MMPPARPRFEIVAGTANADDRRLVSVATFRAITGLSVTDINDANAALLLDGVLSQCATSCRLARAGAAPLTLAQEAVRATWPAGSYDVRFWPTRWFLDEGRTQLLLPWRAPITAITITEGETDLVENTDFQLLGAGVVERLSGCWPLGGIIADYTAGWVAPAEDASADVEGETLPADLVRLIVDQARMTHGQGSIDPNLRSEDIAGVWSGTYNVPGGDSIDTSGLMRPLWDALQPFRAPPSIG
jgi:hypothetical protein